MRTGIKNGKLPPINMYVVKLLFLFIIPYNIYAANLSPKTDGKWVVVIDPGHGGIDPGALGSFSKEKDINLAIAQKTAEYIRENIKNVNVVLTRNDDNTVDLIERPKIANRNNADLFISIHANWAKSKNVMGAETWIMGLASNEENLAVAMKENEVILLEDDYSTKYQGFDPKSPESYIIFTLTQSVYQKQSTDLASKIQTQLTGKIDRRDRGVKQAGFWVLFNTTMPSVLVETGFITNQSEERYLNSKQGQDSFATAIFSACKDYIDDIANKSSISVGEPGATKKNNSGTLLPENKTVFMVQVATSITRIEIKPENFKGLTDIFEINVRDRFKYATGIFDEYSQAVKYREKIETIYPDAFVIAVKDNKILPLQQALEQRRKK